MIGAFIMHPRQSGPCVVCGDTNYNLSCGGPPICPKCDCGNFDAATVMEQTKVIADLREQLAIALSSGK
jgi:predicted nucleic-acid-binding Zn-ribbon protein